MIALKFLSPNSMRFLLALFFFVTSHSETLAQSLPDCVQGIFQHRWCDTSQEYFPTVESCAGPWRALVPIDLPPPPTITIDANGETNWGNAIKALGVKAKAAQRLEAEIRSKRCTEEKIENDLVKRHEQQKIEEEQRNRIAEEALRHQSELEEQKNKAAVAQKQMEDEIKREEGLGYKSVAAEDFVLDKKELSSHESKIVVTGTYVNVDGDEVFMMKPRNSVQIWQTASLLLGLLTENSPRDARKLLLEAGLTELRLFGRAVPCEWRRPGTTHAIEDVCLAVDGVWRPAN